MNLVGPNHLLASDPTYLYRITSHYSMTPNPNSELRLPPGDPPDQTGPSWLEPLRTDAPRRRSPEDVALNVGDHLNEQGQPAEAQAPAGSPRARVDRGTSRGTC